jgi:hypothetical protein
MAVVHRDERQFLQSTLDELRMLEEAALAHYHGVLAGILTAARRETEMLMHEERQGRGWPTSAEERWARHQ